MPVETFFFAAIVTLLVKLRVLKNKRQTIHSWTDLYKNEKEKKNSDDLNMACDTALHVSSFYEFKPKF